MALDQRMVVQAGAGSGKTTSLVRRVAHTISSGVRADQVAVITFTDKAARELVHRLRVDQRLANIDDAYIGTIHGYCASILRSFPIEAGLPPKFTTADQITSTNDRLVRQRTVVESVYESSRPDVGLREALEIVADVVGLRRLGAVVDHIDGRWDRFSALQLTPASVSSLRPLVAEAIAALDTWATAHSAAMADRAEAHVRRLDWLRHPDRVTLANVVGLISSVGPTGQRPLNAAAKQALVELRAAGQSIVLDRIVVALRQPVLDLADRRIADGHLGYDDLLVLTRRLLESQPSVLAQLRQRYQRVFVDEFQDTDEVQFQIIDLLTRPDEGEHRADSPRLFAVGDPQQSIYRFRQADVSLFHRLADDAAAGGYHHRLVANFRTRSSVIEWINEAMVRRFESPLLPDKQQRLTDIIPSTYEGLQATRPADDGTLFDPGPAVMLLGVVADESGDDLQPMVHPSAAHAAAAEAADIVSTISRAMAEGWGVLSRPSDDHPWSARPCRLADIAILVARRAGLGETTAALRAAQIPYRLEGGTLAYDQREVYELLRVLRAVDNPVDELMVATALRTTVMACSDLDLFRWRHRSDGSRGYWRPGATLRLKGKLSDDELDSVQRVHAALGELARWSDQAHHRTPAELLAQIADERMAVAAAEFEGRHGRTETWRRVRYLIDEARSWSDDVGGTLAEFIDWVGGRVEALERTEIAPDEHEDSVRILTIHAAKGLEFPVTIVAGLGGGDNNLVDTFTSSLPTAGAPQFRFGQLRSAGFPDRDRAEEWAEEARLLYVAMTRAQDHLVVSGHSSRKSATIASRLVGRLPAAGAELWRPPPRPAAESSSMLAQLRAFAPAEDPSSLALAQRPSADRRRVWTPSALAHRNRHPTIWSIGGGRPRSGADDDADDDSDHDAPDDSHVDVDLDGIRLQDPLPLDAQPVEPTDAGLRKDGSNGLDAIRTRGRYGNDIGTAVHEVLQLIDLAHPLAGLPELAQAACDNVDLADPTAVATVERLARSVVTSELFDRLASSQSASREIYVGASHPDPDAVDDPLTIWGYIDAAFRTERGTYAIIDFKTDGHQRRDDELRNLYGPQLGGYAWALERATGGRVDELWLLIASSGGSARQVSLDVDQYRLDPVALAVDLRHGGVGTG